MQNDTRVMLTLITRLAAAEDQLEESGRSMEGAAELILSLTTHHQDLHQQVDELTTKLRYAEEDLAHERQYGYKHATDALREERDRYFPFWAEAQLNEPREGFPILRNFFEGLGRAMMPNKIAVIREVRERYLYGLKEAKDLVEWYYEKYPLPIGEPENSGVSVSPRATTQVPPIEEEDGDDIVIESEIGDGAIPEVG